MEFPWYCKSCILFCTLTLTYNKETIDAKFKGESFFTDYSDTCVCCAIISAKIIFCNEIKSDPLVQMHKIAYMDTLGKVKSTKFQYKFT